MSAHLYMIAGEPSGDALGGRLMAALNQAHGDIVFDGVGGDSMHAQGLQSFTSMDQLCVMGIAEIIREYPRLRRLAYDIIEDIENKQPDVVVTIDLPDFNFAVAKQLKKRGIFKGKIIHYVAPSVWAWRPARAKKIAQFLDGLLCLFPFEPQYFQAHGLHAAFIGHSIVETDILSGNGEDFKKKHNIVSDQKMLGVFFGSRMREIETHGDVFIDAMKTLNDYHFIIPTLPKLKDALDAKLSKAAVNYTLTADVSDKYDAFAACDQALAVSGTVGLELAYAGIPHIIAYKTSPLTAFIIKRLIKTDYAHLGNILLQKPVVPELLQERCAPENIAHTLKNLPDQTHGLNSVRALLKSKDSPSYKAAHFILAQINAF